jgi:glyoxylase-like metal-dependent hydrolase (beta-lactamase superfamily II)
MYMLFRQIMVRGDNFSYLLADEETLEAAVVDSSYNAEALIKEIKKRGLQLKYVIRTHGHSDHTAGDQELKQAFKTAKTVAHKQSPQSVDVKVDNGSQLEIGAVTIQVIHTPGHTPDGICLLVNKETLLTGDTLFVGECGRTDLPGGNPKQLYQSLFGKILKLPDTVAVYPGHDYGANPSSTIGYERQNNYVLKPRNENEFADFMNQP